MNKEADASEQYHDSNERDIQRKQQQPVEQSEAIQRDPEIDPSAIKVLPGTGGPDDVGDVQIGDHPQDG